MWLWVGRSVTFSAGWKYVSTQFLILPSAPPPCGVPACERRWRQEADLIFHLLSMLFTSSDWELSHLPFALGLCAMFPSASVSINRGRDCHDLVNEERSVWAVVLGLGLGVISEAVNRESRMKRP